MKIKFISMLMAVIITAALIPVYPASAAETSGTCGENLTWTLDNNGTLTISGMGKMEDWSYSGPWGSNIKIKTVIIQEGVTSIGDSAFYNCRNLTNATIPGSVTSIGDRTFDSCDRLTNVIIPSSVTNIGNSAFERCNSLTNITIPGSVTSIGDEAFTYCDNLASITIQSGVTSIGNSAFEGCDNLTNLIMPDSVIDIGDSAFAYCGSLPNVTIPNSVTSIGHSVFEGCSNLTSVTIPDSVTDIGDYAFAYCGNLPNITIPNSVTSIGNYAFTFCGNFTSITIPNSVTNIGNGAFLACHNLTSITIPNSVTNIGDEAFFYCMRLTSITIPDSVTNIGTDVFYTCYSLETIHVEEGNPQYVSVDGILFDKAKTMLIVYPSGKIQLSYRIPDSVTSIGKHAFSWCLLTNVTIPSSVTSIGNEAFYGSQFFENINVEERNSQYTSLDGALFDKAKTTLIAYPIGKEASSYVIPNSVTSISNGSFAFSPNLTSVTIPGSVTNIGSFAFEMCDRLLSVTIPGGVTSIADGTFIHCDSLKSVTIPNSITSIGESTFSECISLTDVYYNGSEEQWNNIEIDFGNEELLNATIHYNSQSSDYSPGKGDGYETTGRFGKGVSVCVKTLDNPIPNATVKLGEFEAVTDSNGIAYFPEAELRKYYVLGISADGYFDYTGLDIFYSDTKEIVMLGLTDNIFVPSVFYGKGNNIYGDLLDINPVTISNTDGDTYFIKANVDWGNNPEGTISLYGKNSKKSLPFNGDTLTAAIGTQFPPGEEFELIIKTGGKTYSPDLKLRTQALPDDVDISLPDIESDMIPSTFPFLGDNAFKFKLDLTEAINTSADVKIEDDKVVITMDYGNDKIKRQYAKIFGDDSVEGTVGLKIELPVSDLSGGKWAGYVTFKSGNKEKNKQEAQYLDLASLKKTFWVSTPGGVVLPVYMTLDLSASLDAAVGVEYQKPDWKINGEIEPGIKGRFSGGLGVAYDSFELTAGPYGTAEVKANVTLNPISMQPKVKLDFGMQLTAKAWFINARAEFGMGYWEWPEENRMQLMSLESSDIQLIERDYAQNPNIFLPGSVGLFSASETGTHNDVEILSNVFPSVQGRQVSADGEEILLFTNDNTERETQNGLTLMYSKKTDGIWGNPRPVTDDGTMDSAVSADGKFVVWENTKEILSSDETDFTKAMSLAEIAVSRYNGSTYDEQIVLTDNNIADFSPVVAESGENAIVAWLSNTESDILSQNGITNLHYKLFDGNAWRETQTIEDIGNVSRVEVQYAENSPKIIYKKENSVIAVDALNTNEETIYDGDVSQYTSSDDGVYIFTSVGEVGYCSYSGEYSVIAENVEHLNIPQFVTDGQTSYLLWCESRENGIVYCGLKNDGTGWSEKIDFISGDFDVVSPYAHMTENGLSASYIRRENANALPEGAPIPDKFMCDLYCSDFAIMPNLTIDDVNYMDNVVSLTIKNTGTEDVAEFEITGAQNDSIVLQEEYKNVLKAGDTVNLEFLIEEFDDALEGNVTVTPIGIQDADFSDNSIAFNTIMPNPQVLSAKLVSDETESFVEAEIVNSGKTHETPITVELRKGSLDGEVIYSESFENMIPQEKILFRHSVSDISSDYYVCLSAQDDDKLWDNFSLCTKVNPGTSTSTSTVNGKTKFEVSTYNIPENSLVLLALYKNNRLVDIEKDVYVNQPISFTTTTVYDTAKIMVWENLTTMTPVCDSEIVTAVE